MIKRAVLVAVLLCTICGVVAYGSATKKSSMTVEPRKLPVPQLSVARPGRVQSRPSFTKSNVRSQV
jgi:hypothetical protein